MIKILFSVLPEAFVVTAAWSSASLGVACLATIACAFISWNVYKALSV